MRCKICKVTFRIPSTNMRKTRICSLCQRYLDVKKGNRPENELKKVITKFTIREERKKRKPKNRKDGEKEIDEINKLISKALILIRIRPDGISTSELSQKLSVSNDELKKLIPRLLRIDYIFQEEVISDDGVSITKLYVDLSSCQLTDEEEILRMKRVQLDQRIAANMIKLKVLNERKAKINKILASRTDPVSAKVVTEKSKLDIRKECMQVIKYKRKKIDPSLLREVILEYFELFSVKKVCEKHPWVKEKKIRRHLQTPKRLPQELQEKAQYLVSDPESSMTIAMYATDYFDWDGDVNNERKVTEFANKLQEGFQENNDLRLMLLGKRVN